MRLSEAIRLGAMLKPQAFGGLFKNGGSCALGAALDAIGASLGVGFRYRLELFDDASAIDAGRCPQCGRFVDVRGLGLVDSMITHLNDQHHWTREAIADFVATVEPAPDRDAIGQPTSDASGATTRV